MAVLLIGAGVLTLFALFPMGLHEGDLAIQDTHIALFADQVMNGLRSKALSVTNRMVWTNDLPFRSVIVNTVPIEGQGGSVLLQGDGLPHTVNDFVRPDVGISYTLKVEHPNGSRYRDLWYADLKVCFGNRFDANRAEWFYSEFFFSGVP